MRTVVDITRRVLERASRDDVAGLATEIAFRSFLELFPFFIFLVAVGAWLQSALHVQNPANELLGLLEQSLPQSATDQIHQQLDAVLGSQHAAFGLPVLGVLWLAAGSGATLLKAMNRVYGINETRPFWERYVDGLWLTFLGASILVAAILLIGAGQLLRQQAGVDGPADWLWEGLGLLRWPVLVLILCIEAGTVFRVAPNTIPPWRFITPGALLFATGWLLASVCFGLYVELTGGYTSTYGVLGSVIVLLLWLQISASALLLGAELNAVLEAPPDGDQRAADRGTREAAGVD